MTNRMKQIAVLGGAAALLAIGAGVAVAGGGARQRPGGVPERRGQAPQRHPAGAEGGPRGRLRRSHRRCRRGRQDHQGAGRRDEAALGGGRSAALRRRAARRPAASATMAARRRSRPPRPTSASPRRSSTRSSSRARRSREIAKDKGKSVDGLKKALTAEAKTKLDAAVKAGKLTQAQADDLQARMTEHLDDVVNGTGGPGRGFGGHHGFGMGGPPPGARAAVGVHARRLAGVDGAPR